MQSIDVQRAALWLGPRSRAAARARARARPPPLGDARTRTSHNAFTKEIKQRVARAAAQCGRRGSGAGGRSISALLLPRAESGKQKNDGVLTVVIIIIITPCGSRCW